LKRRERLPAGANQDRPTDDRREAYQVMNNGKRSRASRYSRDNALDSSLAVTSTIGITRS
jgi:hypothetical protein